MSGKSVKLLRKVSILTFNPQHISNDHSEMMLCAPRRRHQRRLRKEYLTLPSGERELFLSDAKKLVRLTLARRKQEQMEAKPLGKLTKPSPKKATRPPTPRRKGSVKLDSAAGTLSFDRPT